MAARLSVPELMDKLKGFNNRHHFVKIDRDHLIVVEETEVETIEVGDDP